MNFLNIKFSCSFFKNRFLEIKILLFNICYRYIFILFFKTFRYFLYILPSFLKIFKK